MTIFYVFIVLVLVVVVVDIVGVWLFPLRISSDVAFSLLASFAYLTLIFLLIFINILIGLHSALAIVSTFIVFFVVITL